jgi:hypothetical protein
LFITDGVAVCISFIVNAFLLILLLLLEMEYFYEVEDVVVVVVVEDRLDLTCLN